MESTEEPQKPTEASQKPNEEIVEEVKISKKPRSEKQKQLREAV